MKGLTRKREEHIAQRRRWLAGAPRAAGLPAPRPVGPKNQAGRLARHAETRLLPAEHREMDDLRLDEIPAYLAACNDRYRPLAELVLATDIRIGEVLALTWATSPGAPAP